MEWAILHKIILITVALCSEVNKDGVFRSHDCNNRVTKLSYLMCDLDKDNFHQCVFKVKPFVKTVEQEIEEEKRKVTK